MKDIAVLIMAAGKASRFGSCKQLASYGNSTVLQHVIDTANIHFQDHVFVVTGCYHSNIAKQIKQAHFIYNPDWERGLGSSISHGVSEVADQYQGMLILLADQVAINADHLKQLYQNFDGENIVCAHYQGANGVPALFPQHCYKQLRVLKGDKGAKQLLNSGKTDVLSVDVLGVDMPESEIDIDTRDDLPVI